jgi:Type IV secretion system pilin
MINTKLTLFLAAVLSLYSKSIIVLTKPADPCTAIGGCLQEIDKYKTTGPARNNIIAFIIDVSNFLVFISVGVAVVVVISGGYKMLTSNGNDEQFKKGKQTLLYALIGMIVAILAGTIVVIVSGISGLRLN